MTNRNLIYDTGWFNGYRDLYATDRLAAKRVRAAVNALAREPEPPGSVHLEGSSLYRFDVGDYRILYEVSEETVRVWSIGHAPR